MDDTQRDVRVDQAPTERQDESQERPAAASVARLLANPRRVRRA